MVLRFFIDGVWADTQDLDRKVEHAGVAQALSDLNDQLQALVDAGTISYDVAYQATFRVSRDAENKRTRRITTVKAA